MILQIARFAAGLVAGGGGRAAALSQIKAGRAVLRNPNSSVAARRAAKQSIAEARASKHASPRDRAQEAMHKLWAADSATALFERITSKLKEWTSTFVHTIQVSAIGGPNADLRRTWFLACAAAFGRFRNRVGGTGSLEYQLEATWDVTGKAVMVTLGYTMQGLLHQAQDGLTPDEGSFAGRLFGGESLRLAWGALEGSAPGVAPTGPATRAVTGSIDGARELLMRGPDQVTVGGGWPMFTRTTSVAERSASESRIDGNFVLHQLAPLGEYFVRRFGGPGGPDRPNVLRERPWVVTGSNGALATALPVGQVADLGSFPDFFSRYGGARQPFTIVGVANVDGKKVGFLPVLPDAGRVITTGEKYHPDVQSPRPAADGFSRLTPLQLVTLALEDPCRAPATVAPTDTPVGHKGVRLEEALKASFDPLNRPIFTAPVSAAEAAVADTAAALLSGIVPTLDNASPRITEDA